MITYSYDLDMSPGGVPIPIHVNQYDDDFSIVFSLYSSKGTFTIVSGTSAVIRGTKRDGNGYSADCTIDISNKTVTVAGHKQMTAVAGNNNFELVLSKSNRVLSTANFVLCVERAALDAGTIVSKSVLKELNAIITGAETATEAADAAEAAASRAEAAALTLEIDGTLTQSGQAADAKKTGDRLDGLKSDIEEIIPGLSDEAKAALLACFQHVAWIDEDGQDYYDALEAALYSHIEVRITIINNTAVGRDRVYETEDVYVAHMSDNSLVSRCVFREPLRNDNYVFTIVDSSKYNLAVYNLVSNQIESIPVTGNEGPVFIEGYIMSTSDIPTWNTSAIVTGNYVLVSFKKMDGTNFTLDEISHAIGTIFVVGKTTRLYTWNGVDTVQVPQQWINKNAIIGIKNPVDLALVSGYGLTGYIETNGGKPQITQYRATSLSQAIVGDLDGKTLGLRRYTLSSGLNIEYGIWYGYINPSTGEFNGTQYVDQGDNNIYVYGEWNDTDVSLPVNRNKVGVRVLLMAFKPVGVEREFTQEELREIPYLIKIS